MKRIPNLSLDQIYPAAHGVRNLNTCHNPDCGNFGVAADLGIARPKGQAAQSAMMAMRSNTAIVGLGRYKLSALSGDPKRHVSSAFEYTSDPHSWIDRRQLECQFERGARPCGNDFEILSNEHLEDEVARLRSHNGIFEGPRCGACGRSYLEAPQEFSLNGAENGTRAHREGEASSAPARVRLIHKPCRGRPGARVSATLDHRRQRRTADNVAILMALVNGVGIRKLVRMLAPSGGGRSCSVGRVYERILWLEKTLLAFERAQLARWKSACESSGVPARHHLAHDDIVLTVNWETASDRRLTQLNCSTTADVRSGYVYRIDVDFDPMVDPITMFEQSYVDPTDGMKNLRMAYSQKSGLTFTAPRMEFQRPTGRLDEHHFFASAANQLRVFRDQAGERMPTRTQAERDMRDATLLDLERRMNLIDKVHNDYFNLRPPRRDHRTPFSGVMTRDVYTKAAHFILLREMLPKGVFRLVTEQEGMLPRVLPVAFRDEIRNDRFIWLATTFDKEVKKPQMQARVAAFKHDFGWFIGDLREKNPSAEAEMTNGDRLRAFVAAKMQPAFNIGRNGAITPFQSDNFRQAYMPKLWMRSPLQTAGETNKVVGFPLMRSWRRAALKDVPFNQPIESLDADMRGALAHHVASATLQPVSTFFNALRERLSFAKRSGGRAGRSGPSYISGAVFNPRVLIAVLNIFRVYYNWFEARQYIAPWLEDAEESPEPDMVLKRVPGTDLVVPMAKRQTRRPVHRTPAMRHGIQKVEYDRHGALVMPSLHRVLYRPWIYWGTPVWDKMENRKTDRRKMRYAKSAKVARVKEQRCHA